MSKSLKEQYREKHKQLMNIVCDNGNEEQLIRFCFFILAAFLNALGHCANSNTVYSMRFPKDFIGFKTFHKKQCKEYPLLPLLDTVKQPINWSQPPS